MFLERLYQKYQGKPQSEYLQEAQKAYLTIYNNMRKFQSIFPFAFDGDLALEKRKKGSDLLRSNSHHLKRTLEALQKAYKLWK